MRTLHLFNPSHDEALGADSPYYYPTTIARRLQAEWGALPALWAEAGDWVWLPDEAEEPRHGAWCTGVEFVRKRQLARPSFWREVEQIAPWGWDAVVRQQLRRMGAPEALLPSDEALQRVRQLSSRLTTERLLPLLRQRLEAAGGTGLPLCGRSVVARSMAEVRHWAEVWQGAMVKSLWSCSGRGVFRFSSEPTVNDVKRTERLLAEQGGVEMEPVYVCASDFALEFRSEPSGRVVCTGLSVFETNASGAYVGNVAASETELARRLAGQGGPSGAGLEVLKEVCEGALAEHLGGGYVGPLGIDMMLVTPPDGADGGVLLHPCIEVNLRRTMGHVALEVAQRRLKPDDLPEFFEKICYFCPS